jgi:flagellar operon protein
MADMKVNSSASAAIGGVNPLGPKGAKDSRNLSAAEQMDFKAALTQELDKAKATEQAKGEKPVLKFSNHAIERMNSRGIYFSPEQITKIEQAAAKANQKGGKEALIISDNNALIVSLKNNTIVTVMDKEGLKDNVFTNIDSTVFA